MSQFKIEKGIPPPDNRKGRHNRYPFAEMKTGDSFFIPQEVAEQATVRSAASYFSLRNKGFKFSVMKTADPAGCRVWRV